MLLKFRSLIIVLFFSLSALVVISRPVLSSLHQISKPNTNLDNQRVKISNMEKIRAGAVELGGSQTSIINNNWSLRNSIWKNVLGLWGVFQVVLMLANALRRILPVAIEPLIRKDILPVHWVMYVVWSLYMAYAEGYKGFQLKFSPLVVHRAFSLCDNPSVINYILAGPYCMGLFGASRKRMIVSWSITAGVFALILAVKHLPYPYRSIVDGGVLVGLTYGTLSILLLTIKALMGGKVDAPPETPAKSGEKTI